MEKCPFCHSENTENIGFKQLGFKYEKSYKDYLGQMCTDSSTQPLIINEYLCLDCGMVFKKVSEKNLAEYKEMKPYFKK